MSASKQAFDNLLMEKGMESANAEKEIAELQIQLTELESGHGSKLSDMNNELAASRKKVIRLKNCIFCYIF